MEEASLLWQPGRIGPVRVRNRVAMAPMATNFAGVNGEVTEQMITYYEERARGGPGLVIVEGTVVEYPRGTHGAVKPRIDADSFLPALSRLADAIHVHGAAAALQLTHAGACTTTRATKGVEPVGPSAIPHPHTGVVPHALDREEAFDLVEQFAAAAGRAQKAGFDAIEIHGAHMYLVGQFLSPVTNKREDDFGGSNEKRARFACEIVRAIRRQCGDGLGISFRLSGDEFVEGGRTLAETAEVARLLEAAGVDAIHVSAGLGKTAVTIEPMSFEQGWRAYLAAEIRRAVTVPVITAGVIRYPDVAEGILREGKADFVALGRTLIADPDWPIKAVLGDVAGIRPCISCNAGCIGRRVFGTSSITCTVNPNVGREWRYKGLSALARQPACVAVVGGGPAGMQAAVSAAQAGCQVHLFERGDRLGGQLWPASAPPHKSKIRWLLQHLTHEIERKGVIVHLGEEIRPSQAHNLPGDLVVVAVGSEPLVPPIQGVHQPHVVQARRVLSELQRFPGSRIVVLGGGMVGCECALFLAPSSERVVVIEQLPRVLGEMEPVSRDDMLRLMRETGVGVITGGTVREIKRGEVVVERDGLLDVLEAEVVVLAVGAVPLGEKWRRERSNSKLVAVVGDAARPRSILEAIREGAAAAELAARLRHVAPTRTDASTS